MNKRILHLTWILLLHFTLESCTEKGQPNSEKRVTRYDAYTGVLNVSVDETLEPIIKQHVQIFQFMYDSLTLNVTYKSEKELMEDFRSKRATVMVLARTLEQAEINDFKNLDTIFIRELPVAYDAVALIGHKDFDDSRLDTAVLRQYFSSHAVSDMYPRLVFDNQQSSVVKYVLRLLGYQGEISPNVYALQSAQEVMEYVSKTKNAIGFVPYNLISDQDDDRVQNLLKNIKILSLRTNNKAEDVLRVSANQSDIATGDYPLIRTISTVTRYTYQDNPELLFIGFLHREKGAKIFLKAGLMPVKMAEREIIVNEGALKEDKR